MSSSSNGIIPVRVAVRFRPLSKKEKKEGCQDAIQVIDGRQIYLESTKNAFTYDFSFGQSLSQEDVYSQAAQGLIPQLFQGYNVTILAYGQTGSGKTHTMGTTNGPSTPQEELGIIPRAIEDIFTSIASKGQDLYVTKVSFIELYKEALYDLLSSKSQRKEDCTLDIREDPKNGLHVSNLTELPVSSLEDTILLLESGSKRRVTAATAMNNVSSRSHAIFTFHIAGAKDGGAENELISSKFHLVDLAGSERQKKTKASGERLKEGIDINKGLLALGNVIAALGEESSSSSSYKHIPYRDSKLTRLLQDSLGGNSHTLMIACSSPSDSNLDETISTLRYADRARKIKNKPIVNHEGRDVEIHKLKNEISALRAQLEEQSGTSKHAPNAIDPGLQDSLEQLSKENMELATALMTVQEELLHLHDNYHELSSLREDLHTSLPGFIKGLSEEEDLERQIEGFLSTFGPSEKSNLSLEADDKEESSSLDESATGGDPHWLSDVSSAIQKFKSLNKELIAKEKLVSSMSYNDQKFIDMKNQYEKSLKEMEAEIAAMTAEKKELHNALQRDESQALKAKKGQKVKELEGLIADLKKKLLEQQKTIKINEKNKRKLESLSHEITQMKATKVRLIRQMRDDAQRIKAWKRSKEQELSKVRVSEKKCNFKLSQMETLHCKQVKMWKRKVEETAAINARLKAILDKQKSQRNSRSTCGGLVGSGGRVRGLVDEEVEFLVGYKEAIQTRENSLKERAALASQLNRLSKELKRKIDPEERKEHEEKILELKADIEIHSSEISALQRYICDMDKLRQGTPSQLEALQSMTETKLAIECFLEKCTDALASLSLTRSENKGLLKQVEYISSQISTRDKEISDLKTAQEDAILHLSSEHEEKVRFLLKQVPGLRSSDQDTPEDSLFKKQVSEIRKMSRLNEALFKMKDENTRLKSELENKRTSIKSSKEESNMSISVSESSDEENAPEWKKTPLFARIRSLKRQSLANVRDSSYSSSKKRMESMLEELSSEDDSDSMEIDLKKVRNSAHSGCKCQDACEDSNACSCRRGDNTCGDCCCLPVACSNRAKFLNVPKDDRVFGSTKSNVICVASSPKVIRKAGVFNMLPSDL